MNDVRPVAAKGFGSSAQAYARGRPDYPSELLPWLCRHLDLGPNRTAVDLGAGTGKFTKLLAQTGSDVIAIEPVEAMRAELTRYLPGIRAVAGTAQAMSLPDGSVDAVLCAQAFHWFATEAAVAEIHRVLRPGGRLCLVWNIRDESVDWVAAITDIMSPYEGDVPRYRTGDWRLPFASRLFSDLEETRFVHVHEGSPQHVILDRFLSVSFIAALPDDERSIVAAKLSELIASHPSLKGHSSVSVPYQTRVYSCVRN